MRIDQQSDLVYLRMMTCFCLCAHQIMQFDLLYVTRSSFHNRTQDKETSKHTSTSKTFEPFSFRTPMVKERHHGTPIGFSGVFILQNFALCNVNGIKKPRSIVLPTYVSQYCCNNKAE
jgi:hypothetical protein